MLFSKRNKKEEDRIGGFGFYISLFFLLILAAVNTFNLPLLLDGYAAGNAAYFGVGVISGGTCAGIFFRGRSSVFIHELKHWIAASLAGGRYKKLVAGSEGGHFEFAYSDRQYNAFIALAPYNLPIFTILAGIFGAVAWGSDHTALVLALGVGYGIDTGLNIRDISPHQSDFSRLLGGYIAGLVYVLAFNFTVLTIVLAYVFQGWYGLKTLAYGLGIVVLKIFPAPIPAWGSHSASYLL